MLQIAVQALASWTPAALTAPRDVKSVEKAVRILLLHISRSPHGAPFQQTIATALHAQEERMRLAEEHQRSAGKKRAADESGQNGANKRPKLDPEPAAPALSAAALAQFDFSILPAPLVVEFIIANLQKIPEERFLAAIAVRTPTLLA